MTCYTHAEEKTRAITALGLTPNELRVLREIAEYQLPEFSLLAVAERWHRNHRDPVPLDEMLRNAEPLYQALQSLLDKGLVQVLTAAAIADIRQVYFADGRCVCSDHGRDVGAVDLTWKGAIFQLGLREAIYGYQSVYWCCTNVCDATWDESGEEYDVTAPSTRYIFSTDLESAEKRHQEDMSGGLKFLRYDATVLDSVPPFHLGPWRSQWWKLYQDGYQARITYTLSLPEAD